MSLKRFIGNRKVTLAFSDQSPQYVKACNELKIPLDASVPGRKVTNSLAEGNIQFLVGATATCLLEAGLAACYWTFAVTCVSHLLSIEDLDGGSAWMKMHKENFKGPKIPLGAKVIFKKVMPENVNKIPNSILRVCTVSLLVMLSNPVTSGLEECWYGTCVISRSKVNLAFGCEKYQCRHNNHTLLKEWNWNYPSASH